MSNTNTAQNNISVPSGLAAANTAGDVETNAGEETPQNSSENQRRNIWFSTMLSNGNNDTSVVTTSNVVPNTSEPDGRIRRRNLNRIENLLGIPIQWKELKSQHGHWTCFLCCHVRFGTIAIGLWHMILHLLALALIAIAIIYPEMLVQVNNETFDGELLEVMRNEDVQDVQAVNCTRNPCLLAAQGNGRFGGGVSDFPLSLGNLLSTHRINSEDIDIALFITLCTFLVTLLLIYGAFKKQPSHLMPFFFLQVFDFCITCMTMFGYLSYLPNVRQMVSESFMFPFRQFQKQLLAMDTKCLTFFVILIFLLTFMIKAYCINIVWRCYKYLMQRAEGAQWPLRTRLGHSGPVDQESQTLVFGQDLPDYDTAVADPQFRKKTSRLFPEPPPSYDMAMSAYFAQQQILSQIQNGVAPDDAPLLGESSLNPSAGNSPPENATAASANQRAAE